MNMDSGYRTQHDLQIVLVGQAGPWKGLVCQNIIGLWCDGSLICLERKEPGRKVRLVMTKGWGSEVEHHSGAAVEQEVMRSVSLCPPGPHALLLVLPIGLDVEVVRRDVERALEHMSFLSERAWRHTMLMLVCTYRIASNNILLDRHILGDLVDKCGRGYSVIFVDRPNSELLQNIDQVVSMNRHHFLRLHEVKAPRQMEREASTHNQANRRSFHSPGPRPGTTHDSEISICSGMLAIFGIFVVLGLLSFCYLFVVLSYFYLLQYFFDFVSFLSQCLLAARMPAICAGSVLLVFFTLVRGNTKV